MAVNPRMGTLCTVSWHLSSVFSLSWLLLLLCSLLPDCFVLFYLIALFFRLFSSTLSPMVTMKFSEPFPVVNQIVNGLVWIDALSLIFSVGSHVYKKTTEGATGLDGQRQTLKSSVIVCHHATHL